MKENQQHFMTGSLPLPHHLLLAFLNFLCLFQLPLRPESDSITALIRSTVGEGT